MDVSLDRLGERGVVFSEEGEKVRGTYLGRIHLVVSGT